MPTQKKPAAKKKPVAKKPAAKKPAAKKKTVARKKMAGGNDPDERPILERLGMSRPLKPSPPKLAGPPTRTGPPDLKRDAPRYTNANPPPRFQGP
jgi:hypothetical protein